MNSTDYALQGLTLLLVATLGIESTDADKEPNSTVARAHLIELGLDDLGADGVLAASPLPPLPRSPGNAVADDERAAQLGQRLFYDTRISGYDSISCAGCHPPERQFTNGSMSFRGHEALRRRTPTLINAAYHKWLGWDGRADSLWAQALGPLEDIGEHDTSRVHVAHEIHADPALRGRYEAIFGELPDLSSWPDSAKPVPYHTKHRHHVAWESMPDEQRTESSRVFANAGKAIAAFERKLISGPAPFDTFVEGLKTGDETKLDALDSSAKRGMALFFGRADCVRCHSGPLFTDGDFHDTRLPVIDPEHPDPARSLGIDKLTKSEFTSWGPYADNAVDAPALGSKKAGLGRFRTPSLRNLLRPGGYMHESQFGTLDDVLHFYSTLERARPLRDGEESELEALALDPDEQADIVAFLESLQGTPPPEVWRRRPPFDG